MNSRFLMLSIKPVYAQKIFAGEKTVELRKIRPRITPGDYILVYVSSPEKSLQGVLKVERIIGEPIDVLWKSVSGDAGISADEFYRYYGDHEFGYGIYFKVWRILSQPISLGMIRSLVHGFHPPQSYRYFSQDEVSDFEAQIGSVAQFAI